MGQAAILLQQSGYDIADLQQFTPLTCVHVPSCQRYVYVWPQQRVFVVDSV
jgi:hypothetical protein